MRLFTLVKMRSSLSELLLKSNALLPYLLRERRLDKDLRMGMNEREGSEVAGRFMKGSYMKVFQSKALTLLVFILLLGVGCATNKVAQDLVLYVNHGILNIREIWSQYCCRISVDYRMLG